jgi:hypothetical protein
MLPVAADAQFITSQPIEASMACLIDNSYLLRRPSKRLDDKIFPKLGRWHLFSFAPRDVLRLEVAPLRRTRSINEQ